MYIGPISLFYRVQQPSGNSNRLIGGTEIIYGKIQDDTVTFAMKIAKPFPLTRKGEQTRRLKQATVER